MMKTTMCIFGCIQLWMFVIFEFCFATWNELDSQWWCQIKGVKEGLKSVKASSPGIKVEDCVADIIFQQDLSIRPLSVLTSLKRSLSISQSLRHSRLKLCYSCMHRPLHHNQNPMVSVSTEPLSISGFACLLVPLFPIQFLTLFWAIQGSFASITCHEIFPYLDSATSIAKLYRVPFGLGIDTTLAGTGILDNFLAPQCLGQYNSHATWKEPQPKEHDKVLRWMWHYRGKGRSHGM